MPGQKCGHCGGGAVIVQENEQGSRRYICASCGNRWGDVGTVQPVRRASSRPTGGRKWWAD